MKHLSKRLQKFFKNPVPIVFQLFSSLMFIKSSRVSFSIINNRCSVGVLFLYGGETSRMDNEQQSNKVNDHKSASWQKSQSSV
jgi:hypothetical protein